MPASGTAYFSASPFEVNADGVPMAGAQLFTYITGTTTPLPTYSNPACTIANPNPLIADANGRFGSVWLTAATAYKVQLYTAATPDNPGGTQVFSRDPFGPAAGGAISNTAGIIGEVRMFAGIAAGVPSGWLLCYGQAVNRTTYADLFAVLGTSWGAGDSSTTFNLPDLRGRGLVGKDDMGGSAANRVTAGVSGISGITLGASGGDQHAQQPTLTSSSTSVVTDPQHHHFTALPSGSGAVAGGVTSVTGAGSAGVVTSNESTNITVATTTTTSSNLTGTAQNMQPSAVCNAIIFSGV